VFETPKARTVSLFVTLAVTDVLDIQAGPWRTSAEYLPGEGASDLSDSARPS
jgi:hypothetical protein